MPWMLPVAIAGSAALSAGSQMIGSGKASSAAKDSAAMQMAIQQQNIARTAPFVQAGQDALTQLPGLMPGTMTQAQLEATPGYQFALDQGLKSTQSAAAAKGLGVSGAALKGAASFATGLASNTYQNIFNQQQQRYKDVLDVATLGSNSATGVGTSTTTGASNAGNALQAAGQLQGSGDINATNAITNSLQNYLGYQMYQNRMNPQTAGMTGAPQQMTGFAPALQPGTQYIGGFTTPSPTYGGNLAL